MPEASGRGPERLLVALYALFAIAAGARSSVQIATRFDEAPLAYALSAAAALLYLVAALALARPGPGARRVATVACSVELAGVLVVGTASLVDSALFPDETVWSEYGRGYGFLPLLLPIAGLAWLWRGHDRWPAPSATESAPPG